MIKFFCLAIAALLLLLLLLLIPNKTSVFLKRVLDWFLPQENGASHKIRRFAFFSVVLVCVCGLYFGRGFVIKAIRHIRPASTNESIDVIYPIITSEQESAIADSVKISFTGDLILLRDMVENRYDEETGTYDFEPMFSDVSDYWKNSDLAIGVFEGPCAGEEESYSSSAYDDGFPLYLNYPDSFASAVKKAGINLVTTANNHLLDKGAAGALRTLDVLDKAGLSHTGSYRNKEEWAEIPLLNVQGLKIAVLSYTYGSNYYTDDYFFEEQNQYLTKVIVPLRSKFFKKSLEIVKEDFRKAKALNPDCIIVLPHMGTEFKHYPDEGQKYWCKVFVENGADIVLADHPHAVQPIEWIENRGGGGYGMILYCPGNFINSFTLYDGDASILTEVYLSKRNGKPIGAGIIPLYASSAVDLKTGKEVFKGIPIYKTVKNNALGKVISGTEYTRLQDIHKIITKSVLNAELDLDAVQERYFMFPELGYTRQKVEPLENRSSNQLTELIRTANKICFVGDSITEGTKNGGYGWFEPLIESFENKQYSRFAKGSETSKYFLDHKEEIASENADLYICAFGCNDIRYRDSAKCAMSAEKYIKNISDLVDFIIEKNPSAKFVFIAPWESSQYDPYCYVDLEEKENLYAAYTKSLKDFCTDNNLLFINPNPYIFNHLKKQFWSIYLKDHIHPNADKGIRLYSQSVLDAAGEWQL